MTIWEKGGERSESSGIQKLILLWGGVLGLFGLVIWGGCLVWLNVRVVLLSKYVRLRIIISTTTHVGEVYP